MPIPINTQIAPESLSLSTASFPLVAKSEIMIDCACLWDKRSRRVGYGPLAQQWASMPDLKGKKAVLLISPNAGMGCFEPR